MSISTHLLAEIIRHQFLLHSNPTPNKEGTGNRDRMIIPVNCVLVERDNNNYEYLNFTLDIFLMRMYEGGNTAACMARIRRSVSVFEKEIPDFIPDNPWFLMSRHESCWPDGLRRLLNCTAEIMRDLEMPISSHEWARFKPFDENGEKLRKAINDACFQKQGYDGEEVIRFDYDFFKNWIKKIGKVSHDVDYEDKE